jgi:Zn-dependent alcohol dehydrogenase
VDFRAAVLHEVGRPLVVERVTLGPLGPHDVLVRLHASGLCHTDLEVIEGSLAYPLPIVLGHEGAGMVEAVGAEVTLARRGDHVVCSWNPSCGHCFYCDRGQPILCEVFTRTQPKGFLLDGASRLSLGGRRGDDENEAGGREATFRLAVEAVRPGGTVVFLGKLNVDQPVSFRWGSLMGEKRIVRSSYGGARPRRDFPWLARLYLEGRLKLDELITQRLPLAQVNDGFAAMTKGEVVRAVLGLN